MSGRHGLAVVGNRAVRLLASLQDASMSGNGRGAAWAAYMTQDESKEDFDRLVKLVEDKELRCAADTGVS